jgi:hypothetical protein
VFHIQNTTDVSELSSSGGYAIAFPNPFQNNLRVKYLLNEAASDVYLTISDVTGKTITTKYVGHQNAGENEIRLNGLTKGAALSPGLYLVTINAGNQCYRLTVSQY